MTVQHGHDQAEGLGGGEHQWWEPKAPTDAVAAVAPTNGLDRHTGLPQDPDVPPGGPLGHAELVGQPVGGDTGVALEEFEGQQRPCRGTLVRHVSTSHIPAAERPEWTLAPPAMTENTDPGTTLDQAAKFSFHPGELPNARRLLVDLHDEYARHVGSRRPVPCGWGSVVTRMLSFGLRSAAADLEG